MAQQRNLNVRLNYTNRTCAVCGRVFHTVLTTTVCRRCGSLPDLPPVDPDGYEGQCSAEFLDGTWDTSLCGCPDCVQHDHDEIECQYEEGSISLAEAWDAHDRIELETEAIEAAYARGCRAPTSARSALERIDREGRN